jgi:hypothetical protein
LPGSAPVFRVFVSSTFADLGAERKALHDRVFPGLRRLCAGLGAQFQAIDLRWGVTSEASLDQQAVAICLEEVDRCLAATRRPYFILLLGDRYGWRPLPATVTSARFELLRAAMTGQDAELVELWYVEDRNTVPPVYRLQPRRGRYTADDAWDPVERTLHDAFRRTAEKVTSAAAGRAFTEDDRRDFEVSVTELEIRRALRAGEWAPGAVHAFFRTIPERPANLAGPYGDSQDGRPDRPAAERLRELRAWVHREVGTPYVREYSAGWDADTASPAKDHLHALCRDVRAALKSAIRAELEVHESTPVWQQEDRDHEEFGRDRSAGFVGREDVLAALDNPADPPAPPVLMVGAPGSGKSAVLAELARRLRTRGERNVVVRFIGATPRSVEVRTLVQDLTATLRQRRGGGDPDPPLGTDAAVSAFRSELDRPWQGCGTVLVIDGLDQLAGGVVDLAWLPAEATPGVQVVLSAQTGPVADAVGRYLQAAPVVLEPMPAGEGARLLDSWLAAVGRTLRPHQRAEVLRAFGVLGLPLHLRLAFEEARRWPSWAPVLPGSLADDVAGLVGQLLDRLRLEHGDVLLAVALGCLAAARNGLTEDEELDLLSANRGVDREVTARFPRSPAIGRRIPPVLWARLYSDLQPYLTERRADGRVLLGFFHRQLADEVRSRYLAGETARARHGELARYFARQPLQLSGADGQAPNLRKLSELPYQQANAGLWDGLYATLTDFRFLQAKATWADVDTGADDAGRPVETHSGVYALQDDFDLALALWPEQT